MGLRKVTRIGNHVAVVMGETAHLTPEAFRAIAPSLRKQGVKTFCLLEDITYSPREKTAGSNPTARRPIASGRVIA